MSHLAPLMIESGMCLVSKSGRLLSKAPKIDVTTDRRATATLKRLHGWLHAEALAEAEHSGCRYHRTLVVAIDPKAPSQSDQDTLNELLFGAESATHAHLSPHPPAAHPSTRCPVIS